MSSEPGAGVQLAVRRCISRGAEQRLLQLCRRDKYRWEALPAVGERDLTPPGLPVCRHNVATPLHSLCFHWKQSNRFFTFRGFIHFLSRQDSLESGLLLSSAFFWFQHFGPSL